MQAFDGRVVNDPKTVDRRIREKIRAAANAQWADLDLDYGRADAALDHHDDANHDDEDGQEEIIGPKSDDQNNAANEAGDLAFASMKVRVEKTGKKRQLSRLEGVIGVYENFGQQP